MVTDAIKKEMLKNLAQNTLVGDLAVAVAVNSVSSPLIERSDLASSAVWWDNTGGPHLLY